MKTLEEATYVEGRDSAIDKYHKWREGTWPRGHNLDNMSKFLAYIYEVDAEDVLKELHRHEENVLEFIKSNGADSWEFDKYTQIIDAGLCSEEA